MKAISHLFKICFLTVFFALGFFALAFTAQGPSKPGVSVATLFGRPIFGDQIQRPPEVREPTSLSAEEIQKFVQEQEKFTACMRDRGDCLFYIIWQALMDAYVKEHRLSPTKAEIEAFIQDLHKMDPGKGSEPTRTEIIEMQKLGAENFVKRWKFDKGLYEQYGGRVIGTKFGMIPQGAHVKFIKEHELKKSFEIYDPDLKKAFYRHLESLPGMHMEVSEKAAKFYFEKPSWLRTPEEMKRGLSRVRSFITDLKDPDLEVRNFALAALAELGPEALRPEALRREAKEAVPVIIELLKDKNTRHQAADALQAIGPDAKEASPTLVEVLVDPDEGTSIGIAAALRDIGPGAVPALIEALGDRPRMTRAAFVLGQIGPAAKDALPVLTKLLEHPNPDIRQNARKALKQISGEESPSYFTEWPPVMTVKDIWESTALVYAKIALAQAKAGKRTAAEMTSQEALLIAAGIYNEIDKDKAFEAIAELQAKTGEVKRAVETASDVKNDYRKVHALLGIAKAQAKAGDQQGAQTTFGKAIEIASSLKNKHFALADIAEARAEARDVQGALNTSVLLPSDSRKAEVLAVIS